MADIFSSFSIIFIHSSIHLLFIIGAFPNKTRRYFGNIFFLSNILIECLNTSICKELGLDKFLGRLIILKLYLEASLKIFESSLETK